ncbi:MAG: ABC transporter permease [Janthinobacterium lividum]
MRRLLRAFGGGFRAEWIQLGRSRLLIALTVIQAITFLFLVSLFGLTGSRAPTALVAEDQGRYAQMFTVDLEAAHHSFALKPMDQGSARAALDRGELVAIITIPSGFTDTIASGGDARLQVTVDNVDTDMTEDIQRALPSAILAFGQQVQFPGIRVHVAETDLIDHDTGFIPYLVVSSLVLDAFLIAGILSALAVAREFESGTIKLLSAAPVAPLASIAGRVSATAIVAAIALLFPVIIVILGYHVTPLHPLEMAGGLLVSVAVFSCVGAAIGAVLKRTLPVTSLLFGLSLPLYISSGALEPQRFDGNKIWLLAHLSPAYPAVGILEEAFHGFQVTPESTALNFGVLCVWAVLMLLLAAALLRKSAA